ncbi:hypothetical protein CPC698_0915A, partial [Chlamydia psittaci C6/98]
MLEVAMYCIKAKFS